MQHRTLTDWLLLAALVCCWGSSFALAKIAVQHVTPLWIVALRLALGAVALGIIAAARGTAIVPPRPLLGWYAWLAVIGNLLPFLLITWGTKYVPSGVAGIIMAAVPIAVVVLAHFLLKDERLHRWKAAGVAIGFAGVVILIGPQALLGLVDTDFGLIAKLAIFAATLCYAANGVSARLMPPSSAMARSVGTIAIAAAMALPLAIIDEPAGLTAMTAEAGLAIIGLALFPTALAALILFRLLDRAGASFVSFSNYLVPLFAVLLGWAMLDETIGADALIGMSVILAGILIASRPGRFRPVP